MKLGTKSVLFGVHQFLWHPITVALAWRSLYKRWPCWWEWVAIFCHDIGYIGCPDMDGEVGRQHPVKGAQITESITCWIAATFWTLKHPVRMTFDSGFQFQSWMAIADTAKAAHDLALGHSRFYAAKAGIQISDLFRADKLCVRFDPAGFYILRGTLSGEIWEYLMNAPAEIWDEDPKRDDYSVRGQKRFWYGWYRNRVEKFA